MSFILPLMLWPRLHKLDIKSAENYKQADELYNAAMIVQDNGRNPERVSLVNRKPDRGTLQPALLCGYGKPGQAHRDA